MRASSIWFCSGRELDFRRCSPTCESGRPAVTLRWRSICLIAAAAGDWRRSAWSDALCAGGQLIMLKHNRTTALRREFTAADKIPYTAHVAPTVIRTTFGDYLQVFRLGGASFESLDDEELNNWHERLNVLWRNVGGPNVALWAQVIRRRAGISPGSGEIAAQR